MTDRPPASEEPTWIGCECPECFCTHLASIEDGEAICDDCEMGSHDDD